uniref:Alpha/beta hydrolase fold-3 domain-containing protein n=1 Tax=Eptatretus burgeri TaxID=7764 RepID=A0A8C4N2Q7_EPTBU
MTLSLFAGTEQGRVCAQTMLDIPYGPGPCQLIDVYLPRFPCPSNSFEDLSGFMVPPLVDLGIVVVAPEYTMAPKGFDILLFLSSSLLTVSPSHPLSGIYLCGHSAGAHLVAMVLATDWSQPEYGIQPNIRGLSLQFDLTPLITLYSLPLLFEVFLFPLIFLQLGHRLVIAVGQHDPPEFRRQSLEFHQVCVKPAAHESTQCNKIVSDSLLCDSF